MEPQERNVALEIVRGAFAALSVPVSWAAGLPRAAALLLHRARSSEERSASAARARFDTASWSLEVLKHLEWRRFEELCEAYFEALGFTDTISHSRVNGAVDIRLRARGADPAKLTALAPEKSLGLLKFATQGDFLTPTCPRCSIKMTSRKSTGEGRKFWGCPNYPRCKQTLYSSADAPA